MKPIRELLNQLITAQNRNLITISYRGRQLATWAELDITFTDKVTINARNALTHHIQKHYHVQVWWINKNRLHVQETSSEREIRDPKQL